MVPTLQHLMLIIGGGADVIIAIKCTINALYLNHSETILPPSVEELSPIKHVPGTQKVRATALKYGGLLGSQESNQACPMLTQAKQSSPSVLKTKVMVQPLSATLHPFLNLDQCLL